MELFNIKETEMKANNKNFEKKKEIQEYTKHVASWMFLSSICEKKHLFIP